MPNYAHNFINIDKNNQAYLNMVASKSDNGDYLDFNKVTHLPEELDIISGFTFPDINFTIEEEREINKVTKENYQEILRKLTNIKKSSLSVSVDVKGWYTQSALDGALDKGKELIEEYDVEQDIKIKNKKIHIAYGLNLKLYGHATWYDWCIENWGTKWNLDEDSTFFKFQTAWSPPIPILEKLSKDGSYYCITIEEGMDYFDLLLFKNETSQSLEIESILDKDEFLAAKIHYLYGDIENYNECASKDDKVDLLEETYNNLIEQVKEVFEEKYYEFININRGIINNEN